MGKFTDRFKKAAKGLLNDSDDEKNAPQHSQQQPQQHYQQQPQQHYQQQPQQQYQQQQPQQHYREQQSYEEDDDQQQPSGSGNYQQDAEDDEDDQQVQGHQSQYNTNEGDDEDDENEENMQRMQRQTLGNESDDENAETQQEGDDEDQDYEGDGNAQQEQEYDDENGGDQDAEDLAAPDDEEDEDQQPIVAKEERPVTKNAKKSDLSHAGMLMAKQMLAQQTNSFGNHQGKLLTHQDVQHQVVDEHKDQDWRVMVLTTSNHRGEVFQLEAKMDTGADLNFMNEAAARGHQIDYDLMEGPEMPSATVGSGAHMAPDGIATVKYTAGVHQKTYTEDFYVSEGIPHDVILGKPFLEHAHAITVNPEFAKPPDKPDFLLFELSPMDEEKAKQAEEFRKQKQAEREARRNVRVKK